MCHIGKIRHIRVMVEEYKILSKKDYIAFLLIYASYSDFTFSPPEQAFVEEYLGSIAYQHMVSMYDDMNEAQRVETIVEGCVTHLKNEDKAAKSIDLLEKQFWLDGEYCRFEQEFMQYFKNVLAAIN